MSCHVISCHAMPAFAWSGSLARRARSSSCSCSMDTNGKGKLTIYDHPPQLYAITLIGVWCLYFGIAGLSYALICECLCLGHPAPCLERQTTEPDTRMAMAMAMASNGCITYTVQHADSVSKVDKRMMKHPRFIKGQIKLEIAMSFKGFRTSP